MKKIIVVLVLTLVLGTGAAYAATGDYDGKTVPINQQAQTAKNSAKKAATPKYLCGVQDCTKDRKHVHKTTSTTDVPVATTAESSATTVEEFDCGIEGCTKTGTHYHKNYDPENCTNPDGPNPGSGACNNTPKGGGGNGNGDGTGTGICDGTGNGSGTGLCDGTGPKGAGKNQK